MLNAQAVWMGDKLYVGGGVTVRSGLGDAARLYVYIPTHDTWSHIDTPVNFFALIIYHSQLVLVGGREYATVGEKKDQSVTNKLWTLTEYNQWRETLPPMTAKRQWASAVEFADNILVAGGKDDGDRNIDIVEVYNSHHWARAQCLPKPCYYMKSTVLNGHWYLMGGDEQRKVYYASLDSLIASCQSSEKPLPSVWKRLSNVPNEHSSTVVFGNRLIAVRGGEYQSPSSSIHAYSPYTQSWVHVGNMSITLSSTCSTVLPTGELMVIGGWSDPSPWVSCVYKASLNGNSEW